MSKKIKHFLENLVRDKYGERRKALADAIGVAPHTITRMMEGGKVNQSTAYKLQKALPHPLRNEFMELYLADHIEPELRPQYTIHWQGNTIHPWNDLASKYERLSEPQMQLVRTFTDLLFFRPDTEKALGHWVDIDRATRNNLQSLIEERESSRN